MYDIMSYSMCSLSHSKVRQKLIKKLFVCDKQEIQGDYYVQCKKCVIRPKMLLFFIKYNYITPFKLRFSSIIIYKTPLQFRQIWKNLQVISILFLLELHLSFVAAKKARDLVSNCRTDLAKFINLF